MGFEGFEAAPVTQIPHAHRLVVGGAEQVLAARMEHESPHPVVVAGEREHAQAGGNVPDLDRLVAGSGREERAGQVRLPVVLHRVRRP